MMYEPQLESLITQAVTRLHLNLAQTAPFMAAAVSRWQAQLAGSDQPALYFTHPLAFPAILMPWWAEKALGRSPDVAFQGSLAYSTMNGYYYIRLIDNLMDGHATTELELLPALGFFHTQFQLPYQHYFPASHPFWSFFQAIWFHSAEVTTKDASLADIDEATFRAISAQKVCAAKIPLAAVCYRYEAAGRIEGWSHFVDRFGGWHQMLNDLFDWHKDTAHQTRTYFLCEAERRRRSDESAAAWITREGFTWAVDKLYQELAELKQLAQNLASPELVAYLDTRQAMLVERQAKVTRGLEALSRILTLEKGVS